MRSASLRRGGREAVHDEAVQQGGNTGRVRSMWQSRGRPAVRGRRPLAPTVLSASSCEECYACGCVGALHALRCTKIGHVYVVASTPAAFPLLEKLLYLGHLLITN